MDIGQDLTSLWLYLSSDTKRQGCSKEVETPKTVDKIHGLILNDRSI